MQERERGGGEREAQGKEGEAELEGRGASESRDWLSWNRVRNCCLSHLSNPLPEAGSLWEIENVELAKAR